MTTPDPLAAYLYNGGLPRVCEELARLMRACYQAGCDGYQLPRLDEREAVHPGAKAHPVESAFTFEEQKAQFRKFANDMDPGTNRDMAWMPPEEPGDFDEPAHPAPTSSPDEDKPSVECECDDEMYRRRGAHRADCSLATVVDVRRELRSIRPVAETFQRIRHERDETVAELERVRAELAEEHRLDGVRAEDGRKTIARFANEFRIENRVLRARVAVSETEMERVRAENARLVEQNRRLTEDDAAQRKLAAVLGMLNEPSMGPTWPASWEALISRVTQLTESERLVSELRADNARLTGELSGVRDGLPYRDAEIRERGRREGVAESETTVAELRAELAKREAELKSLTVVAEALRGSEQANIAAARELSGTCRKLQSVVEAAREALADYYLAASEEMVACALLPLKKALFALEQPQAEPGREIVEGDHVLVRGGHMFAGYRGVVEIIDETPVLVRFDGKGNGGGTAFMRLSELQLDPPVSEGEG